MTITLLMKAGGGGHPQRRPAGCGLRRWSHDDTYGGLRHGWGILPDAGDSRPQRARSCHPLDGENETYQLFGDDILNGEWLEPREPDGGDPAISYSTEFTWLEDPDPADNTLTVVLSILADGDLEGKVLHIPGAVEADGWEGLYGDLLRRF